ncbi:MAG: AAA family ATPase [Acidocella sp.]|nr:AAA family ATPase [Acidocella sp.]
MDPIKNPFAPGAGTPPPELSGRWEIIEQARIAMERLKLGRPVKSIIAVGLRGVGKTVLLNEFRLMAEARGFYCINLEAHEDKRLPQLLVPALRRLLLDLDRLGALSEHAKRAMRIFKSFMGGLRVKYGEAELALDIDPEIGTADSGDLETDLPDLFAAIGKAAMDRQKHVTILIDELQYLTESEMSALIMSAHRLAQLKLPILVFGAGLPQVVGLMGRSKSYAERLFDFSAVGALSHLDAVAAIAKPITAEGETIEAEALKNIFDWTQGYPFFLQEWGYQAWNAAAKSPITVQDTQVATEEATARLDSGFFKVRFERLTPRERDYVRAMASLPGVGPYRSGDVASALGVTPQSIAPIRNNLIAKGMIYAPAHGDTAFTVPLFEQYLRRVRPD